MKNLVFKGAATALVTPLTEKGVDFDKYAELIEWQIKSGINALVTVGTTGEGSTLSDKEHKEVMKFCVEQVKGRVPVIAGTGSNDTDYAISLTRYAEDIGADAMLLVTPYYNKATQEGLYQSFKVVAECTSKPCILYNVPSRTGCNLLPETALRLTDIDNIVGIKEASGNISQVAEYMALVGDKMAVYSGNDGEIVPLLSLGGDGVISVLSNVCPKETVEICNRFFSGDVKGSAKLQLEYLPLINALFSEVNPIPVKYAVSRLGFGENYLRLPLTPLSAKNAEKLEKLMIEKGIIK